MARTTRARKVEAAAGTAPAAPPAAAPDSGAKAPARAATREKGTDLRLRDLVARVGESVGAASGARRKEVRATVEATLAELGAALARGEELKLPGLGRARVTRSAEKAGAAHMVLKLRRGAHPAAVEEAKEALAEPGEDE